MEYLGTDYGGWLLDLDLVPFQSTIISAGVGEDISFDRELIKRKSCQIIGIDPTLKSHRYIESCNQLDNFTLIKKALHGVDDDVIKIFKNKNPTHVSESILESHHSIKKFDYYFAETTTLQKLFETYNNISVIKMDIEGSEYEVIESLKSIPSSICQICVEFHHFCSDRSTEQTKTMIEHLKKFGFNEYHQKGEKHLAEVTLVRR